MGEKLIELVTPCPHGLVKNHDYGPDYDPIECIGGSRSTVSGFSPEAVQAAARVIAQFFEHWCDDAPFWPTGDLMIHDHDIRQDAATALAAAWAHDFGNPA